MVQNLNIMRKKLEGKRLIIMKGKLPQWLTKPCAMDCDGLPDRRLDAVAGPDDLFLKSHCKTWTPNVDDDFLLLSEFTTIVVFCYWNGGRVAINFGSLLAMARPENGHRREMAEISAPSDFFMLASQPSDRIFSGKYQYPLNWRSPWYFKSTKWQCTAYMYTQFLTASPSLKSIIYHVFRFEHLITTPELRLKWLWDPYHLALNKLHNLELSTQPFE